MPRLFADHAATTPILPEVQAAMMGDYGNPSSLHAEGRAARADVDAAREILSQRLGCLFAEVTFTSSATEAVNTAILGSALAGLGGGRRRILLGAAEHHCVLHTAKPLMTLGYQVETIPCDAVGRIRLEALDAMLDQDVLLVAAMHANNELGTYHPVKDIADRVHGVGGLYLCDAVQTFGSHEWKVDDLQADFVAMSAHKLYGPKGVGALYVRAGTRLTPLIHGGGQEREMRAGTENVAGIIGFGVAVQHAQPISAEARDAFWAALDLPEAIRTVPAEIPVLPGHVHFRVPGITAESLLIRLDRMGLSASSGAACSSGSLEPSHVLMACGLSEAEAQEGIRITFGRGQTAETGVRAAKLVREAVRLIQEAQGGRRIN